MRQMMELLCFFLKWSIICGFVAKWNETNSFRWSTERGRFHSPEIEETQKKLIIIINYFWCDVCDAMLMLMPPLYARSGRYTVREKYTFFVLNFRR